MLGGTLIGLIEKAVLKESVSVLFRVSESIEFYSEQSPTIEAQSPVDSSFLTSP